MHINVAFIRPYKRPLPNATSPNSCQNDNNRNNTKVTVTYVSPQINDPLAVV